MSFVSRLGSHFTIFRNRNFSIYFAGQFVSRIGNSINVLALMWLAHVLTNSTLLMSVVLAASVVPRVLLAPITGVLVDRWPKRKALIVTDVARFLLVLAITVITYTHTANIFALIGFSLAMSVFSTVTMSAFRVVQKHIVQEDQLLQSNSLFQTALNVSQILGPAFAGLLIALGNLPLAFAVDAATFAVSVVTLLVVAVQEPQVTKQPLTGLTVLRGIKSGATIAMAIGQLRIMLPLMLVYNFLMCAVDNLLIIQYLSNVLHQGAGAVGVVDSSMAIGALCGSVLLSILPTSLSKDRLLVVNMVMSALCIAATGFTHSVFLICAYFFIGGLCMSMVNVVFWTGIQKAVPSQHLGAVFGMLGSVFEGAIPLSQLIFGGIALLVPLGPLMAALGILAAMAGTGFLLKPTAKELQDSAAA